MEQVYSEKSGVMEPLKIILFLCNWGPHSAFMTLQDSGADIPLDIKMVRIPCTGRINKSLLFKPFEMGADGVALVGCKPGACRYGSGTDSAIANTNETRRILDILGLSEKRLQLETFLPDDPEGLRAFLEKFVDDIKQLGPSPVLRNDKTEVPEAKSIEEIISYHDIYACQDCGKCTSACPLAVSGKPFSPRALASAIIAGDLYSSEVSNGVWGCLTCGLCYDRCPSAVNFAGFIRDIRQVFRRNRVSGIENHGGFFQSLMRTMTSPGLEIKRLNHLPSGIEVDSKSKILFFGGCAPYFDTFFSRHLGVQTVNIIHDSIRLLNFFDIQPAVLENERCCGHDLLWTGDLKHFKKLAEINMDLIGGLGIEEVITTCPECFWTLSHDYPKQGFHLPFKITHLYDFLETEISKGAVAFKDTAHHITFQDSCRLSRFERRADLPRNLINRLRPASFREMQDSGDSAICCGNSCWTGCDSYSKALQVKRLKQARDTGSNLLLTSCPKCQVHLRCAMEDPYRGDEIKMEMMDLTSMIAKTISWE